MTDESCVARNKLKGDKVTNSLGVELKEIYKIHETQ